MFDFSKYNLQELQAMSDLLDYLREDAGADALSYFCGCSLLQEIKRESIRLSRSILMSLEEQARAAVAPPAEEPDMEVNVQAIVDGLSWCSDRLADLAHKEDDHYAESSQMNDFLKASMLRKGNRDVINLIADICDHYDGLH